MSKKFLTGVIVESSEMTGVAANRSRTRPTIPSGIGPPPQS